MFNSKKDLEWLNVDTSKNESIIKKLINDGEISDDVSTKTGDLLITIYRLHELKDAKAIDTDISVLSDEANTIVDKILDAGYKVDVMSTMSCVMTLFGNNMPENDCIAITQSLMMVQDMGIEGLKAMADITGLSFDDEDYENGETPKTEE